AERGRDPSAPGGDRPPRLEHARSPRPGPRAGWWRDEDPGSRKAALPPGAGRWRTRLRSRFFFQGGDGIRDRHVTGVQTCALPILDATDLIGAIVANGAVGERQCAK